MRGLLGPAYDDTTDEQRAAIDRACALIDARWPSADLADNRAEAVSAMLQVVLGDTTDTEFADRWHAARAAERQAQAQATGAIIAASVLGASEAALADRMQVTRMTVRKALGKG